ncbi:unnamed protein product, partial [Musa acuminata subsp. burmannicoides]
MAAGKQVGAGSRVRVRNGVLPHINLRFSPAWLIAAREERRRHQRRVWTSDRPGSSEFLSFRRREEGGNHRRSRLGVGSVAVGRRHQPQWRRPGNGRVREKDDDEGCVEVGRT